MEWYIIVQLTDGGRKIFYVREHSWTTVCGDAKRWRQENPSLQETMSDLRDLGLTPITERLQPGPIEDSSFAEAAHHWQAMIKRPQTLTATLSQARAAYLQFTREPGWESWPAWLDLKASDKELWFRVATSALRGEPVDPPEEHDRRPVYGNPPPHGRDNGGKK